MRSSSDYYQPLPTADDTDEPSSAKPRSLITHRLAYLLCISVLLGTAFYAGRRSALSTLPFSSPLVGQDATCLPFLPDLLGDVPPPKSDAGLSNASVKYRSYLDSQFATRDIEGLSVAVVTSAGPVFQGNWGILRANESKTSPPITSSSQYRVASVSKLLLTYEAWILEQRGVISWDDRVDKYLPSFKPNYTSFSPYPIEQPPITLHHLATHMSGIGRDLPAGASGFPVDLSGSGPPPENGRHFPSHEEVLVAVQSSPLISPPGNTPTYSNTGIGLLGMALVAANRMHNNGSDSEPSTIAELMHRDVFAPLGMHGTHYLVTEKNKHLVVVPSAMTELIDMDFLDAMNPSGGMFTSAEDIAAFIPTLLKPSTGPLTRATLDRWLRPVHAVSDDHEVGVIWEIFKHTDSHGRNHRLYMKLGELGVTHAAVAIAPGFGYGVVVLMSGLYNDAVELAYAAFNIFQPAFDVALAARAELLYTGVWQSTNGTSRAVISVRSGTLWMDSYVLDGVEVTQRLFGSKALPLRTTGRRDELRLDTVLPQSGGFKQGACMTGWVRFDDYGMRNGASVTLIYFTGGDALGDRVLHVPSIGITMRRK